MYLWVRVLYVGVWWWTLDRVSFQVAECTVNDGEASRMDHPAVPSKICPNVRKDFPYNAIHLYLCLYSYVCMRRDTQILLHTWHEDLWSHRTTLQLCTVSTIRWPRVAGGHWNWKEKVKGGMSSGRGTHAWGHVGSIGSIFTSSIIGYFSNASESAPPPLSDSIQCTSWQLWLNLQVERAEEALPDGLQRLMPAPEHHMDFKKIIMCLR